MARFVVLFHFTEQGARNMKKSPARARAFAASCRKVGVNVETFLWTLGSYDGVLILSAKDQTDALSAVAHVAALGTVRTETLQAYDDKEFSAIVKG